jgi:hypothetical protein
MALDELRRPFLLLSLGLVVLIAIIETGMGLHGLTQQNAIAAHLQNAPRPGYGITWLICIDSMLLYGLSLITASLILPRELIGRLQGVIGIVLALIALVAFGLMVLFALQLLVMMISLLLAPPFGTAAYIALFASFDRSMAAKTLGLLILLKLAMGCFLILAHPRFLENKSLVTLIGLSIGCTLLVSFLHAWPPGFLVSITDALAAVCIAAVGFVWAIVLLVGSCFATVKAVH